MAKIITLIAEAVDRATLQGKIILGQFGLYKDQKKLLVKDRDGNEYDFSSDQYIGDASNNFAGDTGVTWGGTATNVADALDELLAQTPNTTANARGFVAKGTVSDNVTIAQGANTDLTFIDVQNNTGGVYDGSGVFTADIQGAYLFFTSIQFDRAPDAGLSAGSGVVVRYRVNGSFNDFPQAVYNLGTARTYTDATIEHVRYLYLNVGDTVEVNVSNPSGNESMTIDGFKTTFGAYKQAEVVTVNNGAGGATLWQAVNGVLKPLDPDQAVDNNGSIFNPEQANEITEAMANPQKPATIYYDSVTNFDVTAYLDGMQYPRTFDGAGACEIAGDTGVSIGGGAIATFLGGFNSEAGAGQGHALLLGSTTGAPLFTLTLTNAPIRVRRLKLQSNVDVAGSGTLYYQELDLNGFTLTGNAVQQNWYSEAGSSLVTSVFGRQGAIQAQLNDYVASLVGNDSSVSGATVKDGLESLQADIQSLQSGVVQSVTSSDGGQFIAVNNTDNQNPTIGVGTGVFKATADPQSASNKTLTDTTVNGVTLDSAGAGTTFLASDGTYKTTSSSAQDLETTLTNGFTTGDNIIQYEATTASIDVDGKTGLVGNELRFHTLGRELKYFGTQATGSTETNLNNYTTDGIYLTPNSSLTNLPPNQADNKRLHILVMNTPAYITQTAYNSQEAGFGNDIARSFHRSSTDNGSTWSDWEEDVKVGQPIGIKSGQTLPSDWALNRGNDGDIYVSDTGGTKKVTGYYNEIFGSTNLDNHNLGSIQVTNISNCSPIPSALSANTSNAIVTTTRNAMTGAFDAIQEIQVLDGTTSIFRRNCFNASWGSWFEVGGGGGSLDTQTETDMNNTPYRDTAGWLTTPSSGLTNIPSGWATNQRYIMYTASSSFRSNQLLFDYQNDKVAYRGRESSGGAYNDWKEFPLIGKVNDWQNLQLFTKIRLNSSVSVNGDLGFTGGRLVGYENGQQFFLNSTSGSSKKFVQLSYVRAGQYGGAYEGFELHSAFGGTGGYYTGTTTNWKITRAVLNSRLATYTSASLKVRFVYMPKDTAWSPAIGTETLITEYTWSGLSYSANNSILTTPDLNANVPNDVIVYAYIQLLVGVYSLTDTDLQVTFEEQ